MVCVKISKAEAVRLLDGSRSAFVYKYRGTSAMKIMKHFTPTDHEFVIEGWKWENLDTVPTRLCAKSGNVLRFYAVENHIEGRFSERRLYGVKEDILCWRTFSHGHEIVIIDEGWNIGYYVLM